MKVGVHGERARGICLLSGCVFTGVKNKKALTEQRVIVTLFVR